MISMLTAELIDRRRRQLHVHAILYYNFDSPVISDKLYDDWSRELKDLHKAYPELVHQGYRPDLFADWTGDTGMHLGVDEGVWKTAVDLLKTNGKNNARTS